MRIAQAAKPLQKAGCGRHHAHVGRHGFHNDSRNLALIGAQRLFHAFQIVITAHQRVAHNISRNAGAGGCAERQRARTRLHQQAVTVAVVTPFKLDDFIARGKATRGTQSAHGGFRSRIDHAHHLHAGIRCRHQLGHLDFRLGGQAVAHAVGQCLLCRLQHVGVRVAQNHRPPRADIVEPIVAVDVRDMAALCAFDKYGAAPYRAKRPHRAVHAAGQHTAGALKHLFGMCRLLHPWYSFHARA